MKLAEKRQKWFHVDRLVFLRVHRLRFYKLMPRLRPVNPLIRLTVSSCLNKPSPTVLADLSQKARCSVGSLNVWPLIVIGSCYLGQKQLHFGNQQSGKWPWLRKTGSNDKIATEKRKTQETPPWLFFALLIFSPVFNSCFVSDSEQLPLHRTIFFRQKLRKSSLSDNMPDFLLVRSFFSIFEILMFSGDRCRPHQTTVFR